MENIEQLEKRLWESADQLRANSKLTSNQYCMPVLGLIFLRHAYNRFLKVKAEIEPGPSSSRWRAPSSSRKMILCGKVLFSFSQNPDMTPW